MPDENKGTRDGRLFEAYDSWTSGEAVVHLARDAESYQVIFVTPRAEQEDLRQRVARYLAGDTRPLIWCELGTQDERAARKLAAVLAMFASMVKVPVTDDARLFELLKRRVPELRQVAGAEAGT
jgi:IS1 family transposase